MKKKYLSNDVLNFILKKHEVNVETVDLVEPSVSL